MLRAAILVLSFSVVAACGGASPTAASRAPTSGPTQVAPSGSPATTGSGGLPTAADLCALAIPGTDEAQYDEEISPGRAGIAVRTGRVSLTIGLPAGDAAQTRLTTLAAIVLQRVSSIT